MNLHGIFHPLLFETSFFLIAMPWGRNLPDRMAARQNYFKQP
jgi:hypothetical protein